MSADKTTLQVLVEGRALIAEPGTWTTDAYARNDQGEECDPLDPAAACFCSLGAIAKVMEMPDVSATLAVDDAPAAAVLTKAAGFWIAAFNDSRTQEEVLAAWDRAIAAEVA